MVVSEAMTYGLPIITTTKCLAGVELVKNGINGFVLEVDDYNGLASSINTISRDSRLRRMMSQNSFDKMQNYTIENMAKVHYEAFEHFTSDKMNC